MVALVKKFVCLFHCSHDNLQYDFCCRQALGVIRGYEYAHPLVLSTQSEPDLYNCTDTGTTFAN